MVGVPDRAKDPKRQGTNRYPDNKRSSSLDALAGGDDSGISYEYMEKLDKQLRKRPGK